MLRAASALNPGAVAITGGAIDGAVIGGVTPAAITGTVVVANTRFVSSDFRTGANDFYIQGGGVRLKTAGVFEWSSTTDATAASDTVIARAAANSVMYGGSSATTTSRTELNKSVTAIADNVATAVLTVTIPNAAHSASLLVRVTGSLGAGGAIGANEATATNSYVISLTRTAGVNAVATISPAFGVASSAVAGAATITSVATMSVVSGAVGATNTFTVNVTIVRGSGSSTNHTCLVFAQLMNANVTGITIA